MPGMLVWDLTQINRIADKWLCLGSVIVILPHISWYLCVSYHPKAMIIYFESMWNYCDHAKRELLWQTMLISKWSTRPYGDNNTFCNLRDFIISNCRIYSGQSMIYNVTRVSSEILWYLIFYKKNAKCKFCDQLDDLHPQIKHKHI